MLSRIVPAFLVRWFAGPYVAGDCMEDALAIADAGLRNGGQLATLDLLGEDVHQQSQVEENVRVYEGIIDALSSDPRFADATRRPTISIKPSAFTTGPFENVRAPIESLVERAHERGVGLTIDMEDHRWTDFTLDLSIGHFERGRDVGTVLQTRLNRTEQDLQRIPAGMRLRLVIGIYNEPAAIALTDKAPMKDRMVEFGRTLLERGAVVEFGTHDEACVERFSREVAVDAPDRCEVQLLLGVPRTRMINSLTNGEWGAKLPVRRYVPFAVGWDNATAYLRRRMDEVPSMAWLVLRNLFASRADR